MAEQKIHLGKFINNLDSEDLSSEKLQGVVNNVYAKAVSTHKKKAKEVEERTKEQEEDTVTFVKSNHDRLKAHKNKPEKDLNKDDAKEVEPKGKTAKGVEETKGSAVVESKQVKESFSVVDLGNGSHFGNYSSIDQAKGKALQYYSLRLNDGKLAIVDGSMNPVGIVNRDGTISKEARQVKEARADAPEYHDVSDEEIAMELADRYYNHEIDLPRLHGSLKRLFGSTKKAVEWFADYDLARRTVRKRAGKPVEESKELNAKTPFRKVNESHDCKRNYKNVRFASQEIEKKGYSHEEANDIALKLFDDIEGDTQRSLEWHLEKILPKEDFDRENQKLTEADDSDNLVVKGVTVTGVKDDNVTSVVVPEGIRYIGKGAFYRCTKLKEIKLPETLEGIESDAFAYCTSLEQLEIPKKVQYINTGAFAQCPNLKVLKLPAKFTKGDLGSRGIGFNTDPKIVAESKNLLGKNIVETSIPRNATKIKVGGKEFTKEKDWVDGNRVHVSPKDIKRLYGNDVEVLETDPNYKSKRTKEVKVLQGNYGYGWDDLVEYDKEDSAELKQDLKSYRENERNAQFRVVTRRVPLGEEKLTEDAYDDYFGDKGVDYLIGLVKDIAKKGDLKKYNLTQSEFYEVWEALKELKRNRSYDTVVDGVANFIGENSNLLLYPTKNGTHIEVNNMYESKKVEGKKLESAEKIQPGNIYSVLVKELPAEDIDHHYSDLYVRKTPKSTEIVNRLTTKSLLSTFKDNIDGDIWYELPFCYTPFFGESKELTETVKSNLFQPSVDPWERGTIDTSAWVKGTISKDGAEYQVSAKVFNEPSQYGINHGRISKLWVKEKGYPVAINYDRGWVDAPPHNEDLLNTVIKELEDYRDKHPISVNESKQIPESKKLKEAGWTDDDMAINFVVTRFPKKNEWGSTITRKWKTMESAQKFADKEFPDDERIVIRQEEVYKKNPDLFSSSSPVLVRKEDKKWYTPKEAFKESKKLTESEDDFDELKQEWQEFLELGHNNVIEFEDGDYLYFDIDFDKHIMFAGSATNTGVLRQYEIYLDPSLNLDENIAELYDEIVWNKERDKTESSGKQKLGTLTNGHELFIDTSYGSGYQLCAEDGFGNYNPWTEMGPNNVLRVIEFDSPEDVVEFAKLHYGDKLVLEDEFITESKKLTKSKKLTESQTQELEKIFKELDADYGIDVDAKLSEYTNGDYDLWVKTMFSEKGWKKFEKWLNKQGIFDKSTHFAISKAENWPLGTGDYWESGTERFTTVEDAKKFADKKFKSAAIVKIEDDRNHFSTASGESVRFKGTWMTQQDFFKLRNSGKA